MSLRDTFIRVNRHRASDPRIAFLPRGGFEVLTQVWAIAADEGEAEGEDVIVPAKHLTPQAVALELPRGAGWTVEEVAAVLDIVAERGCIERINDDHVRVHKLANYNRERMRKRAFARENRISRSGHVPATSRSQGRYRSGPLPEEQEQVTGAASPCPSGQPGASGDAPVLPEGTCSKEVTTLFPATADDGIAPPREPRAREGVEPDAERLTTSHDAVADLILAADASMTRYPPQVDGKANARHAAARRRGGAHPRAAEPSKSNSEPPRALPVDGQLGLEVREVCDWFKARWEATQGSPYGTMTRADALQCRRVLKDHPKDVVVDRLERGLTCDDPWLNSTDRKLAILAKAFDRPALRGVQTRREPSATAGIEQWLADQRRKTS